MEKRPQAKQLYIDGCTLSDIAQAVGVNIKTVSTWKKQDGDWEKLRAVHAKGTIENLSHTFIAKVIFEFDRALLEMEDMQLSAVEKVGHLTSLADSFARAVNANKKLMPEVDKMQVTLEVIEDLGKNIQTHAPDILDKYLECVQIYLQ